MATNTEEYYPDEMAALDREIRLASEQVDRAIMRLHELLEKRREYQDILGLLAGRK